MIINAVYADFYFLVLIVFFISRSATNLHVNTLHFIFDKSTKDRKSVLVAKCITMIIMI